MRLAAICRVDPPASLAIFREQLLAIRRDQSRHIGDSVGTDWLHYAGSAVPQKVPPSAVEVGTEYVKSCVIARPAEHHVQALQRGNRNLPFLTRSCGQQNISPRPRGQRCIRRDPFSVRRKREREAIAQPDTW